MATTGTTPEQQVNELNLRLVQMEQRQQELIAEVQSQRAEVQSQRARSDQAEQELLTARAQSEAHRISLQSLQQQLTQQGSASASAHQQQLLLGHPRLFYLFKGLLRGHFTNGGAVRIVRRLAGGRRTQVER